MSEDFHLAIDSLLYHRVKRIFFTIGQKKSFTISVTFGDDYKLLNDSVTFGDDYKEESFIDSVTLLSHICQ